IVLAHGILGFRKLADVVEYFNGVKQHLEEQSLLKGQSLNVLVPEVDPEAGVRVRGPQLREKILKGFGNGSLNPAQKTHIIAHSLGGLDARSILSKASPDEFAKRITSLTTIGTPHQGSLVADILFRTVDGKALLTFGPPLGGVKALLRNIIEKLGIPLDLP